MLAEKKLNIEHYEMLYIVSNKYAEDEANGVGDKIKNIITDKGGVITHTENWGKKKLAYKIKSNNYGYYQLAEFDLEKDKLVEVEKLIRLSSDILRHQVVKKRIKTAEEIERDKKIAEKIAAKNIEEKEEEEKTEEKKIEVKKIEEKKKVNLKDLDEKLDKILETDDLI
jgi:small subunit ribosomal protein S6